MDHELWLPCSANDPPINSLHEPSQRKPDLCYHWVFKWLMCHLLTPNPKYLNTLKEGTADSVKAGRRFYLSSKGGRRQSEQSIPRASSLCQSSGKSSLFCGLAQVKGMSVVVTRKDFWNRRSRKLWLLAPLVLKNSPPSALRSVKCCVLTRSPPTNL